MEVRYWRRVLLPLLLPAVAAAPRRLARRDAYPSSATATHSVRPAPSRWASAEDRAPMPHAERAWSLPPPPGRLLPRALSESRPRKRERFPESAYSGARGSTRLEPRLVLSCSALAARSKRSPAPAVRRYTRACTSSVSPPEPPDCA